MKALKNLILGTPLEAPAKKLARLLRPAPPPTDWDIRVKRDADLTAALLRSVLRKDSCCVDIGANKGDFLDEFVALAPAGRIYAFEPIPAHAEALARRYPKVEVHHCALSNREGQATFFHVPNRDAWSGLQKQNYPNQEVAEEITVELRRLDDVVPDDVVVDFVKVDVEGAELEVLQGAVATLKRCRPVLLFEHAAIHNENYDTTPDMIVDLLVDDCGMTIYNLARTESFDRQQFKAIYASSHASNYDRNAQTNFVALFE